MIEVNKEDLESYLNHLYDELGLLQNEIYDLMGEIEKIEDELSCIE